MLNIHQDIVLNTHYHIVLNAHHHIVLNTSYHIVLKTHYLIVLNTHDDEQHGPHEGPLTLLMEKSRPGVPVHTPVKQ